MEKKIFNISIEKWLELSKINEVFTVKIILNGNSMEPLVRCNRDYVIIAPVDKIERGDIVLFLSNSNKYVVHRVCKVKEDCVKTLGDNCRCSDGWIDNKNIYGKVIKIVRNGNEFDINSLTLKIYGRVVMWCFPIRKILLTLKYLCYCFYKGRRLNG